jgi:hypothetical protein
MRIRLAALGLVGLAAFACPGLGQTLAPSRLAPRTYGISNVAYVTVPEWQFTPAFSSLAYGDLGSPARRYPLSPLGFFLASPTLPSGALLQSLEFDFCNQQPPGGNSILLGLYGMDSSNANQTLLATITAAAGQGCTSAFADLSGLQYTVDNHAGRLLLQLVFGNNADSTTSVAGAIVGYRLQVSPAPASPTFSDVPVSDPAFQFIEALAASGITGGCGNGQFCPNNSVTRRQMAVFLSKALGLYFP